MSVEIRPLWKGKNYSGSRSSNIVTSTQTLTDYFHSLIPEIEENVEGVKVDKEEDADPSDDEDLES